MTTSTNRKQDAALANLKRDARAAIRNSERQHARIQILDFNERLRDLNYSGQVKLCQWWIRISKQGGGDE